MRKEVKMHKIFKFKGRRYIWRPTRWQKLIKDALIGALIAVTIAAAYVAGWLYEQNTLYGN